MTTINAISRQIRLTSIPMVHSPGMIRWILATIAPFDQPKAIDLLEAMGLQPEDAVRVAANDPTIHLTFNDEDGTVLFSFDA